MTSYVSPPIQRSLRPITSRQCLLGTITQCCIGAAASFALVSSASADSINDLQLVLDGDDHLIVSVAYTYDSDNGDCMEMVGVADDPAVRGRPWPIHEGADIAFLNLRNVDVTSSKSTTEIDAQMLDCDGNVVFNETFVFNKSWSSSTADNIETLLELPSRTPKKIDYAVRYIYASARPNPVEIRAKALFHGAAVPFSQGSTGSGPLTPGVFGTATGSLSFATTGTGETNALLLEMREQGVGAFFTVTLPLKKYWSDDENDGDGDGLSDAVEALLGTDPGSDDTDDDGLKDGWEAEGYVWPTNDRLYTENNLPFRGTNPRRRDVMVAVDYLVTGARDQKMHIDSIVAAKKLFGDLPISNPDGSSGIDVRIFHDDAIAPISEDGVIGGVCGQRDYEGFFEPWTRRLYHWAMAGIGAGGQAWVDSNRMVLGTGAGNPGATDWDKFIGFSIFSHELGHNLGLLHEGRNGSGQTNCKPNYFSLMNYGYDYSFNCSPYDVETHQIRFSDGSAPTVDLSSLSETSPPAGLEAVSGFESDLLGCNYYGVSTMPTTIDWDRDGFATPGTVAVDTSDEAPACAAEGAQPDQRDSNDYDTIVEYMASSIESPVIGDCEDSSEVNGFLHLTDTPELQPVCGIHDFDFTAQIQWVPTNPVFRLISGVEVEHPQLRHHLTPLLDQTNVLQDPKLVDEDNDQVPDVDDNCLGAWNPGQEDENGDGIGTACQCGDLDWNGQLDQSDVDLIAACVQDPQTCQYSPDRGDTDHDGQFTQADIDNLNDTIADPTENPSANLRCGQRPLGQSRKRGLFPSPPKLT